MPLVTHAVGLQPPSHSSSQECASVQDAEQHIRLLPDLAGALAAALHAKQVPVQDLLGCAGFISPAQLASSGKGRPAVAQAFARLAFQAFIDADGARLAHLCDVPKGHKVSVRAVFQGLHTSHALIATVCTAARVMCRSPFASLPRSQGHLHRAAHD